MRTLRGEVARGRWGRSLVGGSWPEAFPAVRVVVLVCRRRYGLVRARHYPRLRLRSLNGEGSHARQRPSGFKIASAMTPPAALTCVVDDLLIRQAHGHPAYIPCARVSPVRLRRTPRCELSAAKSLTVVETGRRFDRGCSEAFPAASVAVLVCCTVLCGPERGSLTE